MSDSELGIIILAVLFILLIVGYIYASISGNLDKEKNKELIENILFPSLVKLDNEIKIQIDEFSKWVISCEKCNFRSFKIKNIEETRLTFTCEKCDHNKTLKCDNTFYQITSIPKLFNLFSEITELMNQYNLPLKYIESKRDGFEWNKPFEHLLDSLNYSYFTFKFYNKHTKWIPDVGNLTFNSDGSEMERVIEKLEKKKIEKLSSNRIDLDEKIIREWGYKKITTGKKGIIIKNWAKKSGLKCIDGSKCGGAPFNDLPNNEITFGHIVPQSWGVEYPYMIKTIHHPDNLYLCCKSCNASLNSNFPSTELKNKISKREGTIGDWLRTHIEEFE